MKKFISLVAAFAVVFGVTSIASATNCVAQQQQQVVQQVVAQPVVTQQLVQFVEVPQVQFVRQGVFAQRIVVQQPQQIIVQRQRVQRVVVRQGFRGQNIVIRGGRGR